MINLNNTFGKTTESIASVASRTSSQNFSIDAKSVIDASIISKLEESAYILTAVSTDSTTTSGMIASMSQYIWPSVIGNIPSFRDSNGTIYVASDRGQLFRIGTVTTSGTGPTVSQPTRTDVPSTVNPAVPPRPVVDPPLTFTPISPNNQTPLPSTPPVIPPGGILGSGQLYTQLTVGDIVPNQEDIVTRAMWSGGLSNLLEMHINPNQTVSQLKYYIEVYNTGSLTDCLAEPQFSVAFGQKYGSGSEDQGVQTDDTPTRAIYGQYRMLCLHGQSQSFTIGGEVADNIYVINVNRARFKDFVDEGNWQLNLQTLTGYNFDKTANNGYTGDAWLYTGSNVVVKGTKQVVSLIDDSRLNDPTITQAGEVYNIVSGSLENYNINGGVYVTGSPAAPVVYGLFYKRLGVYILDAKKLDNNLFLGTVIANSTGGGEIAGDNPAKLFKSMSGSAIYTDLSGDPLGFQARSAERVKSTQYFCRVKNAEYNFSNNPSFVTGSQGDLLHPIMINNPNVWITTVGLYNEKKDLVAVAKLSKPFKKTFGKETVVRVKLEY